MTITLLFRGPYSTPDSCDTPYRTVSVGELACFYRLQGEGPKKDKKATVRVHYNPRDRSLCDVDLLHNRWTNLLTGPHEDGDTPMEKHATILHNAGLLLDLI